jgi:hypothetical protein
LGRPFIFVLTHAGSLKAACASGDDFLRIIPRCALQDFSA